MKADCPNLLQQKPPENELLNWKRIMRLCKYFSNIFSHLNVNLFLYCARHPTLLDQNLFIQIKNLLSLRSLNLHFSVKRQKNEQKSSSWFVLVIYKGQVGSKISSIIKCAHVVKQELWNRLKDPNTGSRQTWLVSSDHYHVFFNTVGHLIVSEISPTSFNF